MRGANTTISFSHTMNVVKSGQFSPAGGRGNSAILSNYPQYLKR